VSEPVAEWRKGLRFPGSENTHAVESERALLRDLEGAGLRRRLRGQLRLLGPGYLQSAMTLGSGTASSALFAGAVFGYQLLWVAPLGMAMGVCMLAAVSWQTLSTGQRPWEAMREHAGPFFAWAWALGALLSSMIWQLPQYALASAVLVDLSDVAGLSGVSPSLAGAVVLVWALGISSLYGRSALWVRRYERVLQAMVWGVVVCFGLVVLRTGIPDWGAVVQGFLAFEVPGERNGVTGTTLVLSGLAAAVGVNMVFLYPYSLLARGWGREHRSLARLDLALGMFVPYTLAVSLVVIATANTLHLDHAYDGVRLSPVEAARVLGSVLGQATGRVAFGLGVLGMALSSITLQMLTCGFVAVELAGVQVGSFRYHLATWLPAPAVLGVAYWSEIAVWVAVPTNIVCGLFLPAAYVGFCIMQRSRSYLGEDRPEGWSGRAWLGAMIAITLFLGAFLAWYAVTSGPAFVKALMG
jgi:Mn2+/Fe2+ NRAMP family transporter